MREWLIFPSTLPLKSSFLSVYNMCRYYAWNVSVAVQLCRCMSRSCSAAKANASIEARQVGQRCLHVAAPASTSTAKPTRRPMLKRSRCRRWVLNINVNKMIQKLQIEMNVTIWRPRSDETQAKRPALYLVSCICSYTCLSVFICICV